MNFTEQLRRDAEAHVNNIILQRERWEEKQAVAATNVSRLKAEEKEARATIKLLARREQRKKAAA